MPGAQAPLLSPPPGRSTPDDVRTLMLDFQIPRITAESVEDNRGSFTVEPLDRGFGYTFGNSLRRVLLASLSGAAVTSVRIEGVAHEFSTIKGVTEDVTDIVLNLKGIVCRMHSDATEIEAPLVVTGPGERGEQHAAKRVAERVAEAAIQRLDGEGAAILLNRLGGDSGDLEVEHQGPNVVV